MKRLIALFSAVFLAGCLSTSPPITDFSDRSVVYGWVDVSGIQGNNLIAVSMRRYNPISDLPFYNMGYRKFKGGYAF